jgi:hypothetical protein
VNASYSSCFRPLGCFHLMNDSIQINLNLVFEIQINFNSALISYKKINSTRFAIFIVHLFEWELLTKALKGQVDQLHRTFSLGLWQWFFRVSLFPILLLLKSYVFLCCHLTSQIKIVSSIANNKNKNERGKESTFYISLD